MKNALVWLASIVCACGVSAFAQNRVVVDNQPGEPAVGRLIKPTKTEAEVPNGAKAGADVVQRRLVFPAPVQKTGQTTSYQTGDDGDVKKGAPLPNPRFTVGTGASTNCVTDNLTGLMWLKNPDGTKRTWTDAITFCKGLDGTAGKGGFSDWRLPNVREMQSLFDYGQCNPALPAGHPFTNVQLGHYWTSTTRAGWTGGALLVGLPLGYLTDNAKTATSFVWPVRGGQ